MMFMNEMDVEYLAGKYEGDAVMGPATRTLENLVQATNACSDGWPYWQKPARAAKKLMTLIQEQDRLSPYSVRPGQPEPATAADVRASYRAIKSFRTREGMDFEIVEV